MSITISSFTGNSLLVDSNQTTIVIPGTEEQTSTSTYTLTWNKNGNETYTTTTVDATLAIPIVGESFPTDHPSISGLLFDGWWTEVSGGELVTEYTVISDDTTFYAHWKSEEQQEEEQEEEQEDTPRRRGRYSYWRG